MTKRERLALIAKQEAQKSFYGNVMGIKSNIGPIADLFPKWTLENWDNKWCAAFVYYCCIKTGFTLPVKYPDEKVVCNFAGCSAWELWASLPENKFYFSNNRKFTPEKGDIVLYNEVFCNQPHDHIGIVLENKIDTLITAEGNINNVSGIVERKKDNHIRGFIRIPNNYHYTKISEES
ncbi:CHAP domain-containing protein [Mycoplasmatota bacterium]|nr:CHAP domain-containing protein [Mycoplasmatota bacterium]